MKLFTDEECGAKIRERGRAWVSKFSSRHLLYVNTRKVLLIKILGIARRVFKCNKNRSFIPNSRVHARIYVRPSCESLVAGERRSLVARGRTPDSGNMEIRWKMRYVRKNSVMHFPVYCSLRHAMRGVWSEIFINAPRSGRGRKGKADADSLGQPLAMRERNIAGIRYGKGKRKKGRNASDSNTLKQRVKTRGLSVGWRMEKKARQGSTKDS